MREHNYWYDTNSTVNIVCCYANQMEQKLTSNFFVVVVVVFLLD